MAVQNATASDQFILATVKRDYHLSLAIFVSGIVWVVAISAYSLWANSTGNYPTSFGAGLAIYLIGTAAGMMILLGGTVAFYNWRFLRRNWPYG
jgi:hypothetical protein